MERKITLLVEVGVKGIGYSLLERVWIRGVDGCCGGVDVIVAMELRGSFFGGGVAWAVERAVIQVPIYNVIPTALFGLRQSVDVKEF